MDSFGKDSAFQRDIDIWLPEGYPEAGQYRVIYMQDGQMLFDASETWNHKEWMVDETVGRLIGEGAMKPAIVVGIHNGGASRHSDYFPQKPIGMLDTSAADSILQLLGPDGSPLFEGFRIRSDRYLQFIVDEVKPYVDRTFSTKSDPADTYIGGSSMGGLISWYAVCEHPDVFGNAICMSTHWTGIFGTGENPIRPVFKRYLEQNIPSSASHRFYFDSGTNGLDSEYLATQSEVDSIFRNKGYTENNYQTRVFKGDGHDEDAWANRFSVPLLFMMGTEH